MAGEGQYSHGRPSSPTLSPAVVQLQTRFRVIQEGLHAADDSLASSP
jgi:hypothetical protein